MVNYRYRLSRLLIPGGIPDPEIGEVELFLASDREGYVNNISLPPDPNCLEINCTPTQCVERIGIWSNQALGPLGTEGFFIAGKPDDENRVTVINVGVVCPLTGTPGRSNYALYPQKQGTLELTTPLIPGLPYAEIVRVSPTAGEFLLRYYKTQGLPHAQLSISRSLANQIVDTEELAWAVIGMVGASIRPDVNVIHRSSEIDATVSEYIKRACLGLLELMDPGSIPGRRGSIPRFVYSLSSEVDIYGPEAEKLQALTEIRVVENCSDCIEVGPNNKRVSREVRDRSCAAVLLALCIAGYGDRATLLAEYLVSRIDSRGRMVTGWTDAQPLSTSLSLDSPTASGTITAALAILAYSRVDRSYLPHAHRLIESARLYYYTSSWGTDAIDRTLGALISRVLVDYADTPSQARAGLINVIGQAVSPTFLALQLELVGDVSLNTTYRAILDNDPTLECGLSLARELSSTSFLGVLDELGPVYRNYLYRIDKTMSRVRGALPTDFGLFSKTAIRSGNIGRILEALVPSISAAYNRPLVIPTAPTKVPATISGILNWLTGLGYQEVYVTEAWREALHVVGNLPTYGNTTLGTGLLGMPRPSARVGVLGRWEERINPAPGGVLVIREGNILGTGIINDTPAVGALVPDDEECNICYWFGICEGINQYAIYCPGVLPDRPIEIIEVNQYAVYCPGVLPDRPIEIIEVAVYCPGVLPDRPIEIIEVNQYAVYCPGVLPDRSISSCVNAFVIDFEGLLDSEQVLNFYDGGYGGSELNFGVSFGDGAQAFISSDADGTGNFINQPSGNTAAFFLSSSGTNFMMNVTAGFTTGFSFFYSANATNPPTPVRVYDGLNGTGNLLAEILLPNNAFDGCNPGVDGTYCNWDPIGISFSGVAKSVDFSDVANLIAFDNITIGCDRPIEIIEVNQYAVYCPGVLPDRANPQPILLDFEGLKDLEEILDFYNGGTGSLGSSGTNYGVSFSPNALAITESGPGSDLGGLPTPETASFFLSGSANTMNVAGGFDTGLSFYYSAPLLPGLVNIYDGLDGTGNLLATINLPTTPNGALVPACNGKNNCPFVPIGVAFSGTARSVDFAGSANLIGFDNITLGRETPCIDAADCSQ